MISLPRAINQQKQKGRFALWWCNVRLRMRVIGLASEQSYVMENLSMLLSSGMDVISALYALQVDVKSKRMRVILGDVIADIENGSALWAALNRSKMLSRQIIALIHIGEESGKLAQNLQVISIQQQKQRDFTSKIRSAMMYPILVLAIAVVIALGMAWFVLPKLVTIFSQMHITLPLITRIIIAIAKFLQVYGNVVIPLFALGFILITYFLFFFSKSKWFGQVILFVIPGVNKLIREVELSRMGYVLGTLLHAGLPIIQSIDSLVQATTFHSYKKFFMHVRQSIDDGHSWEQSLKSFKKVRKVIPVPIQQMIIAGDASGQLPQVFLKIGAIFESKTDTTAKNLTVILEPVLLVIVWLGVASVALAIIMPIYGLIGGLTTQQDSVAYSTQNQSMAQESFTPIPTSTVTPIPVPNIPATLMLQVADTPSGSLNVLRSAGDASAIIANITKGAKFEYVNEQRIEDHIWYNVYVPTQSGVLNGWVIDTYVILLDEHGNPAR